MVNNRVIQMKVRKKVQHLIFYNNLKSCVVATDTLKSSSGDASQLKEAVISSRGSDGQESAVPDAGSSTESDAMISVLKDVTSFKKFQKTVKKNIFYQEKRIIFQHSNPNNNNIYNAGVVDENAESNFILIHYKTNY